MQEASPSSEYQAQRVVLVVEDEVVLRAAAAEVLREGGFTVAEAANADEALQLVEAGLIPGILFTDVRMPGDRDGLQLASELKTKIPQLQIIIASGDLDASVGDSVARRFLRKPYDLDILVSLISKASEN